MKIKFNNTLNPEKSDFLTPVPAAKHLPEWYKEHANYIGDKKKPKQGQTTATIKKCMPVFDMMTAGYLIPLNCDLYVEPITLANGKQSHQLQWVDPIGEIGWHIVEQAQNHPSSNHYKNLNAYPKFVSPWAIQTPKGYSCLFIQPAHRDSVFEIFSGIVDTDEWLGPVSFPFVLKDPNFEGLIPKGTFIAQVIPFKRDKWELQLEDKEMQIEAIKRQRKINTLFFDRYKRLFWQTKEYK